MVGKMNGQPIDDIEAWSKKQSPWRQDCLRRLAISDELTATDFDELLALIKLKAGFNLATQPPTPVAFTKAHFGGGKDQLIVLKGIANVQNVNRLVPNAGLTFCPKSLTIVYGRNGSGKTGFVRILRTACRTRVKNPAKLRVLADVYGDGSGVQSADILIDAGSGDVPIAWSPGMAAAPQLMQVAVFDAASAQLYVDGGNQIRFLPFGLALLHRLNTVCLILKSVSKPNVWPPSATRLPSPQLLSIRCASQRRKHLTNPSRRPRRKTRSRVPPRLQRLTKRSSTRSAPS